MLPTCMLLINEYDIFVLTALNNDGLADDIPDYFS